MNWYKPLALHMFCHFDCLLWCTMMSFPRFVCANWHDSNINSLTEMFSEFFICLCICCISSKNNMLIFTHMWYKIAAMSFCFMVSDRVCFITLSWSSCSSMSCFSCTKNNIAEGDFFVSFYLSDIFFVVNTGKQTACISWTNKMYLVWKVFCNCMQRLHIPMIHMSVWEEYIINFWYCSKCNTWWCQSSNTNFSISKLYTNFVKKYRVC